MQLLSLLMTACPQAVEIWWEIFDLLDTAGDDGQLIAKNSRNELKVGTICVQPEEAMLQPEAALCCLAA